MLEIILITFADETRKIKSLFIGSFYMEDPDALLL